MTESIDPVSIDVGDRADPAVCKLSQHQGHRQRAARLKADLPVLSQDRGKGSRPSSLTRGKQGHLQRGDPVVSPGGRGPGRGARRTLADHPLDGGGETVVGRAVLSAEPVGYGAQGAFLGEQRRSTHTSSDPPELDQDGIRSLHHQDRHRRPEVVHHLHEGHLQVRELAMGELGSHVEGGALGQGPGLIDRDPGRQIPGFQLAARSQNHGARIRCYGRVLISAGQEPGKTDQESPPSDAHGDLSNG